MPIYTNSFLSTLPPAAHIPLNVRMPAGTFAPVKWAFQDEYGNPISLAGKSIALSIFTDYGPSQVNLESFSVGSGLTINGPTVVWQPAGVGTSEVGVYKYTLIDTTDGSLMASGVLSLTPTG